MNRQSGNPGLIMLFFGLAVILNGLMFTLPRKQVMDHADEALAQKASTQGSRPALQQPA
ncbi:MAG: hypothetical protein M3410_03745 [Acidobacteriota bacterium]|nr:hypothetical protein [Acidobacteriota bacterium]